MVTVASFTCLRPAYAPIFEAANAACTWRMRRLANRQVRRWNNQVTQRVSSLRRANWKTAPFASDTKRFVGRLGLLRPVTLPIHQRRM